MIVYIVIFNIVLILFIKIFVVFYINNLKKKGRNNNIFCKKCRDYFIFNFKIKKILIIIV